MPYFKTPSQVAEELGLKEPTVRRLARQYKTFTRAGVRVMFAPDDVEALIDKIKNPPKEDGKYDAFGFRVKGDDPFA
ncbi:helix-turn-helix domain-containing protein [Arthrobacter sp. H16F315]|uniref:helix-turn-helix domain-containing protein n=1 Tax=Arthrobacter sp. H16F315 TaxID=2955314 RepID=UPI002096BB18|nr:helix-turn-helix domain-containing protein [Arthrobacter sp. H16F315]MDD1477210.1 helix-turn-helix domain-containing protein [Arthrobacter sp. H16F315]